MFNNVSKIIQNLAIVFFILGLIASFVVAIILWSYEEVGLGFLVWIGGSIVSYLSSIMLYGYGKIIENQETLIELQSGILIENNNENEDDEELPEI